MESAIFHGFKPLTNLVRRSSLDVKKAVCASAEGEAKLPPATEAMLLGISLDILDELR